MLDKFRLFNSKDKAAKKSSVPKTSSSSRSSSSSKAADQEPDSGKSASSSKPAPEPDGSESPKAGKKGTSKKGIGRLLAGKKEVPASKEDSLPKRSSSAPGRTPSPNPTVSSKKPSPTSEGGKIGGSSKGEKGDTKGGGGSPTASRKVTRLASLAPKGPAKTGSKSSLTSSQSSIPAPSTGIPKPGKGGKTSTTPPGKEDNRSKSVGGGSKEHSKGLYSSLPSSHSLKSPASGASKSMQRPSSGSQLTSPSGSSSSSGGSTGKESNSKQQNNAIKPNNISQAEKQQKAVDRNANAGKNGGPSPTGSSGGKSDGNSQTALPPPVGGAEPKTKVQKPRTLEKLKDHSATRESRVDNLKKAESHSSRKSPSRSDGGTQTAQSSLLRSASRESTRKLTEKEKSTMSMSSDSCNSTAGLSDSNNSNTSGTNSNSNSGNSVSSTDSVIFRPSSCDELEMSGMESDSNANPAPKQNNINATKDHITVLKEKKMTDHIQALKEKRAKEQNQNNIQASSKQPKMETTFDTEVRTETKTDNSSKAKETTFGDEAETEDTFDIKPMQPINMRSGPYGYLGLARNTGKPLHIPGLTLHSPYGGSSSNRLGSNRPILDPKLYTNSMKRTVSNCTNVLESDYGSDAEDGSSSGRYDISSGYMSDGDILKSKPMDDFSGYMSEGGASLYARRMQQRFREGMQAVKESMQKSSGVVDDDR